MAKEAPLNVEQFFITRNEIASKHNSKLELQAMARVREHLVEVQEDQAQAQADKAKATANKKDTK